MTCQMEYFTYPQDVVYMSIRAILKQGAPFKRKYKYEKNIYILSVTLNKGQSDSFIKIGASW